MVSLASGTLKKKFLIEFWCGARVLTEPRNGWASVGPRLGSGLRHQRWLGKECRWLGATCAIIYIIRLESLNSQEAAKDRPKNSHLYKVELIPTLGSSYSLHASSLVSFPLPSTTVS